MTFIEFKKSLLDAEISLPKFCKLIKISDKNLQSYKKKGDVPNTIAVIVTCFVKLHQQGVDYRHLVEHLNLTKQTKTGGFKKKSDINGLIIKKSPHDPDIEQKEAPSIDHKKTKKKRNEED